ncbi:MAG: ArsR family transcriptional regulator [Candidatus Bathyarchaeia archaeon]
MRRMENIFAGLSDRTRLKILRLIAEKELRVCEVSAT